MPAKVWLCHIELRGRRGRRWSVIGVPGCGWAVTWRATTSWWRVHRRHQVGPPPRRSPGRPRREGGLDGAPEPVRTGRLRAAAPAFIQPGSRAATADRPRARPIRGPPSCPREGHSPGARGPRARPHRASRRPSAGCARSQTAIPAPPARTPRETRRRRSRPGSAPALDAREERAIGLARAGQVAMTDPGDVVVVGERPKQRRTRASAPAG